MNCEDLHRILDDGDTTALSRAERHGVAVHLAGCDECAAAWAAHEAVGTRNVAPIPPAFAERLRRLVVSSSAPPRRAGGRPYVIAGLLIAGAAAAAVVGLKLGEGVDPVNDLSDASLAASADVGNAEAGSDSDGNATAGPGPATAGSAAEDDREAPSANPGAPGFTVAVTPLRQIGVDADLAETIASTHDAFLDALESIPGLVLIELDESEAAAAAGASTAVRTAVVSADGETIRVYDPNSVAIESSPLNADGGQTVLLIDPAVTVPAALVDRIEAVTRPSSDNADLPNATDPEAVNGVVNAILANNVEGLRFESLQFATGSAPPQAMAWDYLLELRASSTENSWNFGFSARSRDPSGSLSFSAGAAPGMPAAIDGLVANLIGMLRENVFPPDPEVVEPMERTVLDATKSLSVRLAALGRLRRMEIRNGGSSLVSGTAVAAVLALVPQASQQQRAEIWQGLRGIDDPQMVPALSEAVRYESDEWPRLEAVISLARFADNPSARAVLDLAGRTDESQGIRLFASWAALDDAGRRDQIVASLMNAGLSDADRLAPLLFEPRAYESGGAVGSATDIRLGPAVDAVLVSEVTALLARHEDQNARMNAVVRLAREDNAALIPLYIDRLTEDGSENVRMAAMTGLQRYRDDPAVRFALERAMTADSSANVRRVAERTLAGDVVMGGVGFAPGGAVSQPPPVPR